MQVLALVGDQLDCGDNICGAVLSIRFNEDILSVWNRNASDHHVSHRKFTTLFCHFLHLCTIWWYWHSLHQAVMALRDSIKRHLKLPHGYVMEYKPHDASLRDNSSYRNTWLRGWSCGFLPPGNKAARSKWDFRWLPVVGALGSKSLTPAYITGQLVWWFSIWVVM